MAGFQTLVGQLHKNSKSMHKLVASIGAAKLCPVLAPQRNDPALEMGDVFDRVRQHQTQVTCFVLL